MNNTFNFKRFVALFKKTLLERPIQLFGLTLMTLALVLLIYSTSRDLIGYPNAQFMTFFLGLVGGGYFLSSTVYGYFGSYARGAAYLTLPASTFEKWLNGIVIVLLLYVPLFLAFFRIMDSTLVEVYRNNLDPNILDYKILLDKAVVFSYDTIVVLIVFKIFLTISGLMLLGSLYFNKMAIIKVALVSSVVLFLIIGANYLIAKAFIGENISAMPFFDVSIKTDSYYRTIALPQQAQNIVSITFLYLLPSLLYLLAFIRLKEKEF